MGLERNVNWIELFLELVMVIKPSITISNNDVSVSLSIIRMNFIFIFTL